MKSFKRKVVVGKADTGYKQEAVVTVDIEWDGERLSISGDATRPGPGDRMDSAGQITDMLNELTTLYISPYDRDRLVEEWHAWHLNDMRPGCEHQTEAGWSELPIDPSKPTNIYGRHFEGQKSDSWNLLGWVRPDEHPEGLLTRPCGICGYKYGTEWNREDVPEDVLEFLATLGDYGRLLQDA